MTVLSGRRDRSRGTIDESTAPSTRRTSRLLCVMVVVIVLGERLALPLGSTSQVPVTVGGMLALTLWGLHQDLLVVERARARLLGTALCTLAVLTVISTVRGQSPSLLSLLLVLLIYLPCLAVATDRAAATRALTFFVDLMIVAAGLGVALFGLQYAGLAYRDWFSVAVPKIFIQQDYVTSYPLTYGSAIYRSNGVFFLEASFFSLFLGLATVISAALRHRTRWLPLLAAGIACTASGNGIVFLLVSLAWMLIVPEHRRRLVVLVAPLAVGAVLLLVTPLGALIASRATELGSQDSSANSRIVLPYELLTPVFIVSTTGVVLGNGAGSVQRYYDDYVIDANGEPPVLAPAPAKLLYEFGLLGALVTAAFLTFSFLRDGFRLPWMPGMMLAYFVVNASLQQATIAAMTILFMSMLPHALGRSSPAPPLLRSQETPVSPPA